MKRKPRTKGFEPHNPFNQDWYFDKVQYSGTDNTTRAVIATVLEKLPPEVAQWAVEKIVFVSVGGEIWGHCLTLSEWGKPFHVIALDEAVMRTRNSRHVVAHELAHAKLDQPAFSEPAEGTEQAADELAAQWGFRRYEDGEGR